MLKTIKTLELERWSEPDEQQQVKRIGMANAQEIFNKLETHLKENNLLPDEYFLFEESNFTKNNGELPEVYNVICNTNFGGSEGIYLDIILKSQNGNINFATGKTLDDSVEAFYKMSRIGTECSLMLNSYGNEFKYDDKKTQLQEYKLNKEENTVYIILEKEKSTALLKRIIDENESDPTPYIIANGINFKENNLLEWDSGKYYSDISSAVIDYSEEIVIFKEPLIGEIDFLSPTGKVAETMNYTDVEKFKKDITECLNDGVPIEVRDYSNQNIYSNAVIKSGENSLAKISSNLKNLTKLKELENLQKYYSPTAPIIADNENSVSIFTKMYDDNSAVKYEIEYNPFGFNGKQDKFMYVDTYKDIYNTYPSIEDVKEFMNVKSYEKFINFEKSYQQESWQDKLSHSDKDNDGIPDIIDNTYDPPEYFYRYVSSDEFNCDTYITI